MATRIGASALSTDDRIANDEADWKRAHAALSRLARERAGLDAEEGRWLLSALRSAAHVHLGFASFVAYTERLFGYKPRTTQEKLRVAEALEDLPQLARALQKGALGWCAVRELTRVAVPETESAWLDAAGGKTLRELEALVANQSLGDAPDAPPRERPRVRVLRFEVSPETFATFREALLTMRRQASDNLNDDAILLAMARHVLGGPRDEGRASYQIALHVCGACGAGAQSAAGELEPVGPAVVGMALCDGQHIGEVLPSAAVPPAAAQRAANENASADAAPLGSDAAANRTTRESSDHAHTGAENRQPSDAASASGATPRAATPRRPQTAAAATRPSRAKQTIPPALRRAVLARDRHRCTVPGCTHATFVDVHHVQPRSEGGRHEASNLLTLCSAHHRAAHRGELLIERDPDATVHFRHADGAAYGAPLTPGVIDAHSKVFSAISASANLQRRPCYANCALTQRSRPPVSSACYEKRSAGYGRQPDDGHTGPRELAPRTTKTSLRPEALQHTASSDSECSPHGPFASARSARRAGPNPNLVQTVTRRPKPTTARQRGAAAHPRRASGTKPRPWSSGPSPRRRTSAPRLPRRRRRSTRRTRGRAARASAPRSTGRKARRSTRRNTNGLLRNSRRRFPTTRDVIDLGQEGSS